MTKSEKIGFSLVELSIVLVIIGILVSISLSLGAGQIGVANIKSTQTKLDRIDQALALYLKTNGSLPCPADGSLPITNASFGKENTRSNAAGTPTNGVASDVTCGGSPFNGKLGDRATNSSSVYIGVIPTKALNFPWVGAKPSPLGGNSL